MANSKRQMADVRQLKVGSLAFNISRLTFHFSRLPFHDKKMD